MGNAGIRSTFLASHSCRSVQLVIERLKKQMIQVDEAKLETLHFFIQHSSSKPGAYITHNASTPEAIYQIACAAASGATKGFTLRFPHI